jgi:hypothetical protein
VIIAVLIALLILWHPQQTIEYRMLHDARAVHDTALLRFDEFEVNGSPCWVVANVTQGSSSGATTTPGAYIKAETGEMVVPENARPVLIKEGTWKSVATAKCISPTKGSYSWTEVLQRKRVLLTEDFYSPFIHGGTIIFRHTPGAVGINQFGAVHLLIPEYVTYVGQASDVFKREMLLFQRDASPVRMKRLENEFLTSENKLLRVFAFRALVLSGHMSPNVARDELAVAKGHLRALMSFLLITQSENDAENTLLKEMINLLATMKTLEEMRPIVVSAFSASLLTSSDNATLSRSKTVLNIAFQRLKELRVSIEGEPDFLFICEKMDLCK